MELIRQFNKYAKDNQSLIQKALTTATGVGGALIPENLEKLITDTLIRLSPELAMALMKKISGKTHEFNRLIQRPSRGGAMGENATTPITNSKTVRDSVELKIIRRKGKVTNFMIDTSEEYIDAAAYEMENHIIAGRSERISVSATDLQLGEIWKRGGQITLRVIHTYGEESIRIDTDPLSGMYEFPQKFYEMK